MNVIFVMLYFQVGQASNDTQTASVIRQIAEHTFHSCSTSNLEDWLDRHWLSVELSQVSNDDTDSTSAKSKSFLIEQIYRTV